MANTPNRNYPYPVGGDTPEVPRDVKALAEALDVDVAGGLPVGAVITFAGTTVPTGWLMCNGAAFSSTTYPVLRTVLGRTTTPNLIGRFVKGATTPHATGGNSTIKNNQMPVHNHGMPGQNNLAAATTDPGHSHPTYYTSHHQRFDRGTSPGVTNAGGVGTDRTATAGSHAHFVQLYSAGGGQPFEPVFYTLIYMIKAI